MYEVNGKPFRCAMLTGIYAKTGKTKPDPDMATGRQDDASCLLFEVAHVNHNSDLTPSGQTSWLAGRTEVSVL